MREPPPRLIAIDTNILVLLIGYQCLLLDGSTGLQRSRALTALRGRGGIDSQRFDDLWELFSERRTADR